ncbi:hypothetical protein CLOBY_04730 [Clostridium saccharobutylicum]|uniref:hypothetical protein n=1 Tax=Clostridium saccharobutylicum TaxID=169679 RepID=UPI0009840873|nr:hypothetical protein [Clostridium saccharobutylicum]AQS08382.1 hypothetical protein CLOBY_04730 [Clostridium saccharobutylicum]NSB88254.1 DNA-binding CsgD family transcriptional regulator [Clostridium saccharobutylicum]NYC29286.1 DNA-binding CsgD family transcriptional regulator [Clostridium saccharobutylicum]OOM13182.1 hypothetical protein CLSAB_35570 [Clostridium saccharobutylicum]
MRDKDGYWYTNETLINRLDITEQEQEQLKTIIGTKEKYSRNNLKRTPRNEEGLTKKQQELKELVFKLKETGLNNSEIARKLNINKAKVIRLLNN